METALVFGVGPGLGAALARRFAAGGMQVAISARNVHRLDEMVPELEDAGAPKVLAHPCDVTDPKMVTETFRTVGTELGAPQLVIYNVGTFLPGSILETEPETFEHCWQVGCMGGFLVAREAIRALRQVEPRGDGARGTLIFTGATASLRGGAGFQNLAVGKFGLRALAQSLAREFGPEGIHVAHAIIDGQIQGDGRGDGEHRRLEPDAIAESYWALHCQHRSAWTHELDLRPWVEPF